MSSSPKISLFEATLLNVNIMLGTGIFINTVLLTRFAGILGSLSYVVIAIPLLPLLYIIGVLVNKFPDGGFYIYARNTLNPFWGFMSGWIYFSGKLASGSLMIHVATSLLQTFFIPLQAIPTILLDIGVLVCFLLLNLQNLRVGTYIVKTFMALKLIPLLTVILAGIAWFKPSIIAAGPYYWDGIPTIIPYVLYAFVSFEMSCSLSKSLQDPERNGPKALYLSYAIVLVLTFFFQLGIFLIIGPRLGTFTSFLEVFPAVISTLIPHSLTVQLWLTTVAHTSIATSALGGAYGLLFSNHWNLYTLAQHGQVYGSKLLMRLNRHGIPFVGVLVESIFCLGYLLVTKGDQSTLQQIGAIAPTVSFTICTIGFLVGSFYNLFPGKKRWIGWLSLISCAILLIASSRTMLLAGGLSLLLISILILLGLVLRVNNNFQKAI